MVVRCKGSREARGVEVISRSLIAGAFDELLRKLCGSEDIRDR